MKVFIRKLKQAVVILGVSLGCVSTSMHINATEINSWSPYKWTNVGSNDNVQHRFVEDSNTGIVRSIYKTNRVNANDSLYIFYADYYGDINDVDQIHQDYPTSIVYEIHNYRSGILQSIERFSVGEKDYNGNVMGSDTHHRTMFDLFHNIDTKRVSNAAIRKSDIALDLHNLLGEPVDINYICRRWDDCYDYIEGINYSYIHTNVRTNNNRISYIVTEFFKENKIMWGLDYNQQTITRNKDNDAFYDVQCTRGTVYGCHEFLPEIGDSNIVLREDFELGYGSGTQSSGQNIFSSDILNNNTQRNFARLTEIVPNEGVNGSNALKVTYEPFSQGSVRVLSDNANFEPRDAYELSFDVKFCPDFEFKGPRNGGGKLHGLLPKQGVTGGHPPTPEGWSTRFVFNRHGGLATYVYNQDNTGVGGPRPWGFEKTVPNFKFETDRYYNLKMVTKLNSKPDSYDGFVEVWIDGELRMVHDNLRMRGAITKDSQIQRLAFSTFHGGSTDAWSPSKDVCAYFDNFTVRKVTR
ncbi:hypothetical protein VmeM32_00041 [Vibrio phage vB_VmeM-32]|nr:hypothetical protein VmeM32_00041 [Vibrio phage vB_VmeM-32]